MPVSHCSLRVSLPCCGMLSRCARAPPLITETPAPRARATSRPSSPTNIHIEEDAGKQKLALTTLTLSYGVVDSVDLIVSAPYLKLGASESDGTPVRKVSAILGWT